jgi:hypothetical protein
MTARQHAKPPGLIQPERTTSTRPRTYALHGLTVRSDVPLDARPAAADSAAHVVEVRYGERRGIPDAIPNGRLIAHRQLPAGASSLVQQSGGYLLRAHALCEFQLNSGLSEITVHPDTDADPQLAALMIGGALATLLSLDGKCVLHASAVELGGRAVAFIGGSGTGKSTTAALCCAIGARLVSDDVLRVERHANAGLCYVGTRELRLRAGAAQLADMFPGVGRRSSIDQRTGVSPPTAAGETIPLAAIVAPRRAPQRAELRVDRLPAPQALIELLRCPRTTGWTTADSVRRDFGTLAELAEIVPVYLASLPWGPPFTPRLAKTLLTHIQARSPPS